MANGAVAVSSSVVRLVGVTVGWSATGATVTLSVKAPLSPAPAALWADWTSKWKPPGVSVLFALALGRNFTPAWPSARVMTSLLMTGVTPSLLNRLPPVMLVTLKCVTVVGLPSAGFGTSGMAADKLSSAVVAAAADGVSATWVT